MNTLSERLEEAISLSLSSNTEIKEKLLEIKTNVFILSKATNKVANLMTFLSVSNPVEDQALEVTVEQVQKPKLTTTPEVNSKLLYAALIGLLPLLLPKEAVEKIKDFVEGAIGVESVEKLKKFNLTVKGIITTVGTVSAVIVGSFIAIKLFTTVKNTIELIRQLAILTGLISVMSGDEHDSINRQRARLEEHDKRIQRHYQRIARERARLNQARLEHAKAVNAHRQSVIKNDRARLEEQKRLQTIDAENKRRAADLDAREKASKLSEQRGVSKNDARIQAARERAQADIRAQRATATDQARGATAAQMAETNRIIAAERAKIENKYNERVAEINQQHAKRMSDLEAQNRLRMQEIEKARLEQQRIIEAKTQELDKRQTIIDTKNKELNERQLKLNQDVAKLNQDAAKLNETRSKLEKGRTAASSILGMGAVGLAARMGSAALKALSFLVWPMVEAMFGTVQDLFNEDIREKESLIEIFLKNLASALSFGFLNREAIDNTIKVLQGDQETIRKNLKAIEGQSISQAEFGGAIPVTQQDIQDRMLTDEKFRLQQDRLTQEYNAKKLKEERDKVEKDTNELIRKLDEEDRIRAQAALATDYRTVAEKAEILRVTKGGLYSESNKPIKEWLNKFFNPKPNKQGIELDDKSYENAERRRLLRVGYVQVGTVNNTVLINQGAK